MEETSTSGTDTTEPAGGAERSGGAAAGYRPRLRQDVIFAESDDGVYLQRPGDQFVLKGRSTYRWITLLAPRMNGEHTVEQLSSGLPEEHRRTLVNLIGLLAERGYLHDERDAEPARIPAGVRAVFGRQIGYVAHFAHPGEARFMAFRESRFLLLGAPELVAATATGLLRNGAAEVTVTGPAPEALTAEAGRLRAEGAPCTVHETEAGPHGAALAEYDLVIGAGGDVAELLRWNALARSGDGPALLPSLVLGGRAVIGPMVRPAAGPCWQCAVLRQAGARSAADGVRLWRAAALGGRCAADSCPPHLARMLGTLLAFEAFRLRTGVLAPETEGAIVTQDLDTAESGRETLLPHPLCEPCVRHEGAGAPAGEAVLFGKNGGVLGGYRDLTLTQSPLRAGRVLLYPVDGPGTASREIAAFDLDTLKNARGRAVRAAAVCYAEDVAGRGTATSARRAHGDDGDPVPPESLSIHSGLSSEGLPSEVAGAWVPAYSIVDDRWWRVPAVAAYPGGEDNHGMTMERTCAGAACGDSIEAAVSAGLLSALGFTGLRAALRGELPARNLDAAGATGDLDFLLRAANGFPGTLRLLDLPGAEPGFACVVTIDDETDHPMWTLGTGHTREQALVAGLRDLVGTLGLAGAGEPADLGDPVLPGLDPRVLPVGDGAAADRGPACHREIVAALRGRGQDALVVDTTPGDLRSAGLVTVRVLLRENEAGC
ncbi:hypothetical protein CFN78_12600 [Amycolatopsis antarctica]|uniref:YcaO domain-containing protein n=1 Tax=Amycolatopsis antarctica TaxID=1854586 RepID=A0A263D3J6_9PSEU|nr:TOMM precursor leader peptide-binding protein [Amycolatopsis antarctica]OZM73054.1 hypothetical protein CFN78_12600 [Amycolatopsis antarctica]